MNQLPSGDLPGMPPNLPPELFNRVEAVLARLERSQMEVSRKVDGLTRFMNRHEDIASELKEQEHRIQENEKAIATYRGIGLALGGILLVLQILTFLQPFN